MPVAFMCAASACGKKSDSGKKDDAGSGGSTVAPLALPPLGVDRVARFSFSTDTGKALQACTSKLEAKDWAAAKPACESALAKEPTLLDAHRALAGALARTGEHAAAVDHLALALAGDYYKYAPTLADPDLEPFRATSHGQAVAQLAQQIHDEYARRIKGALWLVARRSRAALPDKPGVAYATSHAELFAYDRDSKRFLRLTHTEYQVAAFVRAPSGSEAVVLGYDKVEAGKGADAAPLIARPWIQVYDAAEWKPIGARVTLGSAREIAVGYGTGDQLLVAVSAANGRWGLGDTVVQAIDRSTGKLTKVSEQAPVPRVVLSLDDGRLVRGVPGVEAAWSNDPATTTRLKIGSSATIAIPESGQASQSSVAVAPGDARIAFATWVDPCMKDAAPSLYVADAKTGGLKHLLTARSRFATRWIDDKLLAYEDGDGAIRLWDASTGREAQRLDDRGGLALDVVTYRNSPPCKGSQPDAAGSGSAGSGVGSDDLPPEEPGPVTAPAQ